MLPLTALFVGDSITDAGRKNDPRGFYGNGYVRRIHQLVNSPEHQLTVLNRGIAGNRAIDLRARWERDVLAERPDVLTVLVGINDTWRRYDGSDDPTSASVFQSVYRELIHQSVAAGTSRIVLLEPFLVPRVDAHYGWRSEDLDAKIAAVHSVASEFGADVIQLDSPINSLDRASGVGTVADDGVHPTEAGHNLIADQWFDWARSRNIVR